MSHGETLSQVPAVFLSGGQQSGGHLPGGDSRPHALAVCQARPGGRHQQEAASPPSLVPPLFCHW